MKQLLLAAAFILPASFAAASNDGMISEDVQAQIRTTLTEQGYEVRQIEMEDGMIEVYALKDGQRFELYLDDAYNIVRTKIDD